MPESDDTESEEQRLVQTLEEYKAALTLYSRGVDDLEDGTSVRSYINRNTPAVRSLVRRCGCSKRITISPPPAIGGMIMQNVDPFESVFQRPYGMGMTTTIADMIDESIGVIEAGELPPKSPERKPHDDANCQSNNRVFLVHGRDNEKKQTVARFVEKLGLEIIILHEQSNRGLTIIEKFEENSDVGYAIVLLTPDDVGRLIDGDSERPRARQNVVFELGYFIGKIGRDRVCAIVDGDVELPSDSDGIVYVGYDHKDGWKLLLAKELREAGMNVDMNSAI
jgi:predicted nucleotide-binding protein